MAIGVRPTHLAGVIFLALLHLLARATTDENLHVRSCSCTTTSLPPRGSALPLGLGSDVDAAPPTARAAAVGSGRLRLESVFSDRPHAPPSTLSVDLSPRRLADTAAARQADGVAARQAERVAPWRNVCHKRPSSADIIAPAGPAPRGVTAAASKTKAIADALPLLAVPFFLPPPVAAPLVALSFLAAPARAWSDCSKLTHATCALYMFDNETGTVDRRRPDPTVSAKCEHPLRHADAYERAAVHAQEHGRGDDPLLVYCSFHVLKRPPSILPWLNEDITHMPIADPDAVAASGDRVCYVELTHLAYKEGYYIRCPSPYSQGRVLTCMEFPEEEIVAAVWEHRRLNYRDTVWPRYLTPTATVTEKHADEL